MSQPVPVGPAYPSRSLAAVLPSMGASLGAALPNTLRLPKVKTTCLLMIDGLGSALLKRYAGHAPFLSSAARDTLSSAFPTTTAASLATLGTGLAPGQHGLIGYDVLDPDRGVVVNQLGGWDPGTVPELWQPHPTVFTRLAELGIEPVTVSRPNFAASGLTRAALTGSRFVPAKSLADRFSAARREAQDPGRLIYLYVNELDKIGHAAGPGSEAWLEVLEELDSAARRLAAQLPSGTGLLATGDHGMIDVPEAHRIDYSLEPRLIDGVQFTAGEPRFVQLHFADDASDAVRESTRRSWGRAYGDRAWVLTRAEAVDAGWFGPVDPRVLPRVGELIVAPFEPLALYDGRRVQPGAFEMVGHHGAPTKAEREVPLLRLAS
ncbi:alkaline phosphatase family protein [Citricoccus muralis]|uniref:Alkaline phosphatase family protein n=1 Tax=Citricoccus muralis TaxID=169134 RepID=A0ABY8H479_9MICC|nr:nucleotide pyrophosphatase/phosphodiesterase family protein [Citricoccus muralis]WFP15462.1 alkaline phosphatase family protein [Citricoccus muralis]